MKPAKLDLPIYRGDTFEAFGRIRERVLVEGVYVDGSYVNLTGLTGLAQIRTAADVPTVTATITVDIADQGVTLGGFFLRMTAVQTAVLSLATAKWDLQFTKPDDTVHTFLYGDVTLTKDISQVVIP